MASMMFRPPRSMFRTHPRHAFLRRHLATVSDHPLRTALFFPGHGVQRKGMLRPWMEFKSCREFMEETDSILQCKLSEILIDGTNDELNRSINAQPGIMAISVMILRLLEKDFGFNIKDTIDVTLGHSLGEYAALVASGCLEWKFALKMVRRRGEIMGDCTRKAKEQTGERYGMMALVLEDDKQLIGSLIGTINQFLEHGGHGSKDDSSFHPPAIEQVSIANINSKNQVVLSGSFERIRNLLAQIREFGGHDPRAVEIRSNSPFHSLIMEPAYKYMQGIMKDANVRFPADMPTVSNVTGRLFSSEEDVRTVLPRQTIETVQWWSSLTYLDQEAGTKRWLGVGPGKVGRNLVGKQVGRSVTKGGGVWAISDPKEIEPALKALEESAKELH